MGDKKEKEKDVCKARKHAKIRRVALAIIEVVLGTHGNVR